MAWAKVGRQAHAARFNIADTRFRYTLAPSDLKKDACVCDKGDLSGVVRLESILDVA
jgi:hypothetical protein